MAISGIVSKARNLGFKLATFHLMLPARAMSAGETGNDHRGKTIIDIASRLRISTSKPNSRYLGWFTLLGHRLDLKFAIAETLYENGFRPSPQTSAYVVCDFASSVRDIPSLARGEYKITRFHCNGRAYDFEHPFTFNSL